MNYELGVIQKVEAQGGGAYGRPLLIETETGKYILRRSAIRTSKATIAYERSLIEHLRKHNLPAARIIKTRKREDFVRIDGEYYIVYEYIEGVRPGRGAITGAKLKSAARVLASYHEAVKGFTPEGRNIQKSNIPVVDIDNLGALRSRIEQAKRELEGRRPQTYTRSQILFLRHYDLIIEQIDRLERNLPRARYERLPKRIVYGDYNPYNTRFVGDELVGMFDWDYARDEARIFDIANEMILVYTECRLRLKEIGEFIEEYQEASDEPLTREELEALPEMFRMKLLELVLLRTC